jgi:hypothetical protein
MRTRSPVEGGTLSWRSRRHGILIVDRAPAGSVRPTASPKYLFGESYGTTRSAVLARVLLTQKYVDLNGVILLAQIYANEASLRALHDNVASLVRGTAVARPK